MRRRRNLDEELSRRLDQTLDEQTKFELEAIDVLETLKTPDETLETPKEEARSSQPEAATAEEGQEYTTSPAGETTAGPTAEDYVAGGGYYSVSSITNATTVVLTNLAYPGNAAAAAVVSSGALVSAGGLRGPTGPAGAGAAPTIQRNDVDVVATLPISTSQHSSPSPRVQSAKRTSPLQLCPG